MSQDQPKACHKTNPGELQASSPNRSLRATCRGKASQIALLSNLALDILLLGPKYGIRRSLSPQWSPRIPVVGQQLLGQSGVQMKRAVRQHALSAESIYYCQFLCRDKAQSVVFKRVVGSQSFDFNACFFRKALLGIAVFEKWAGSHVETCRWRCKCSGSKEEWWIEACLGKCPLPFECPDKGARAGVAGQLWDNFNIENQMHLEKHFPNIRDIEYKSDSTRIFNVRTFQDPDKGLRHVM